METAGVELRGRWRIEQGSIADVPVGGEVDVIAGHGGVHWFTRPGTGIVIGEVPVDAAVLPSGQLVSGDLELSSVSPGSSPASPIDVLTAGRPPSIVRLYRSESLDDAAGRMGAEAAALSRRGYGLAAQSWAPPERPILTGIAGLALLLIGIFFIVGSPPIALLVMLIGVGLLIGYAAGSKAGVLTVNFELRSAVFDDASRGEGRLRRPARESLAELDELLRDGVITVDEHATRRISILDTI